MAFPTDTLYGLGADIASPAAVQRVLDMKGRAAKMGLPLLLADTEEIERVGVELTELARLLARRFWPGPLTLVVRRRKGVPDIVTGGRDSVAVRVPDHPVPRALAAGLGRPITGTSANLSGRPAAMTEAEVRSQLGKAVDLIIEADPCPGGQESTIVEVTGAVPRFVRSGAISEQAIRSYLAELGEPLADPKTLS